MDVDDDDFGDDSLRKKVNAPARKAKDASDRYQAMSQIEHILKRPDSYIGSVETISQEMWVFNVEEKRMQYKNISYVPGFFKIFDEILVNAADHKINSETMTWIKVTIDVEKNEISVQNNGSGIPIQMHKKEKVWIPAMIFGRLLTGSSYDDDEKKLTGGRNGYGAKLTNIYSHKFTIETANKEDGKKFKQTWTNNMSSTTDASITTNSRGEEYTKVTFSPDLARFQMESIDDDVLSLLTKRVYDLAGTVSGVTVWLNGEKIKVRGFKQYVDMFLSSATEAAVGDSGAAVVKPSIVYEAVSDRWEYAFAISESGNFQHVSFANSISTTKGGTHVNLITDQICKHLMASIEKKNKAVKIKPAQIKNHMWIFVNSLIENPTFDSQTKEQLTLPAGKFGSKPVVSETFMKGVNKTSIAERVLNWAKFKSDQLLAKGETSKKQTRLHGLAKLSDANNAGGRNSKNCTLILTEGDSAKALAEAGLSVVGRDNFGVFPLRGKLLNVREATHDQIMKNAELQNIKKIMGLAHQKDYKDVSSLRYGSLMIMTDQDHDGSHIKGLLINFLDHFYPSLLKLPSFLVEFVTPIVRVTKGNQKKNFFTIPEYLEWNEQYNKDGKWAAKYYKLYQGLGTSTNEDAKDYFSRMDTHMIPFAQLQDEERPLIDLAFSKKKADDRKDWLRKFKPGTFIDHSVDEITYDDFINRELILFSMADNIRSIPSVVDGLKPGQRKILFGCFKRNLKAQIKVAQLVGYISEKTAYHHGEQSLTSSIVALAQDYVGSNNVNLLSPDGQYGTRFNGGKDAASARYIFTHLPTITRTIFHPHDDPILNYLVDDGDSVEPEWYTPVVPIVLLNGAEGIGTGWSTNVPSYNPEDVVANLRRLMHDEELVPMTPWFRGWKGTIERDGNNKDKFIVTGTIKQLDDTSVEITELPIHRWTEGYKEFLESCIIGGDYKEHHAGRHVHFIVNMPAEKLNHAVAEGLVSQFKLSTTLTTSNLICFDQDGSIKKYNSPEEILKDFYDVRFQFYHKRKANMVKNLEDQVDKLNNQARFVQMIIDEELVVSKRKKADIVAELRSLKFRPFPKVSKAKEAGEEIAAQEDEDAEESAGGLSDYDYLLGMAIWSLTQEKVTKLRRERDAKEEELEVFIKVTPAQLWDNDLEEFLRAWRNVLDADEALAKTSTTKGRKQATLKTRKSIGSKPKKRGADDDDDDFSDFAPKAKKAAGSSSTTARSAPIRAKPAPSKIDIDSEDEKPKPAAKAKASTTVKASEFKLSDDDEPAIVSKPKASSSKAASAKMEIDSEDEKPKPKPKPKAATKKVASLLSDEDDDAPVVTKPKGKAAAKPVAKSSSFLDDDEDGSKPSKAKGKAPVKRKSPGPSDDEDDIMLNKPAPKKSKSAAVSNTLDDFFSTIPHRSPPKVASMKPKQRVVSKASSAAGPSKKGKKVLDSSDDEGESFALDDDPPPVKTAAASRRPARAAATSKPQVVDLSSEPEEPSYMEESD
ncbi:type II DNA topoisomerase [Clavulina sp. PMI_390]|nr:type II DNA topoisomerase [Clavulina sp. PMI_390]